MSHAHEHKEDRKADCCGSHDHSKFVKESAVLNADAAGNLQTTLRIRGMDCADEVEALEQVLRPLKGVREVRVNLTGGKVTLLHDESVTEEQLINAMAPTGVKATPEGAQAEDLESAKRLRQIAVAASGLFLGLGML